MTALEQFLAMLKTEGKETTIQTDSKGVQFFEVNMSTCREYVAEILHLVHHRCVGYVVVRRRGVKEMARIIPPVSD